MINHIRRHPTYSCFLLLVLLLTGFGLTGCTSIPPSSGMAQIAVQYATAKTIEQSESITADGVVKYAELARAAIDRDRVLAPADIADQILRALDAEDLSPADRLLAQMLVLQIQAQFEELDLLDPATRVTLLQVLGWVEQAARLSGGA